MEGISLTLEETLARWLWAARTHAAPASRLRVQRELARIETERFIARLFELAHGARIRQFLPTLLALRRADGGLACACGLRAAQGQALFVEHYLQQPAEAVLGAALGHTVERSAIVEVGNLAVAPPGSARELIVELTRYLLSTHARWVICAALPGLRNAFARLGIAPLPLGPASIECLPAAEHADWGSYYSGGPQVIAIEVAAAARALCGPAAFP